MVKAQVKVQRADLTCDVIKNSRIILELLQLRKILKVQRADLTCDAIKKVAPFVLGKL